MQRNFALCISQKKFRLKKALEFAQQFNYNLSFPKDNNLTAVVQAFVEGIRTGNLKG
jgi:hypothetical protein